MRTWVPLDVVHDLLGPETETQRAVLDEHSVGFEGDLLVVLSEVAQLRRDLEHSEQARMKEHSRMATTRDSIVKMRGRITELRVDNQKLREELAAAEQARELDALTNAAYQAGLLVALDHVVAGMGGVKAEAAVLSTTETGGETTGISSTGEPLA